MNVDVMADLSKTVEAVRDAAVTAYVETRQLKAFVGDLIAERDSFRANALRYLWIRARYAESDGWDGEELDAHIDAEIAATPEVQP